MPLRVSARDPNRGPPRPPHTNMPMDVGDPEDNGVDGAETEGANDDRNSEMDELDNAANAGDQFAAENFFAPVAGVDGGDTQDPNAPAPPNDPSMGMDADKLKQLLELLQQQSDKPDPAQV